MTQQVMRSASSGFWLFLCRVLAFLAAKLDVGSMTPPLRSFASDNTATVHPKVIDAIVRANEGAAKAYGADEHTERAVSLFKREFGDETGVYFVFNGTGANVVGLSLLTPSYGAILCAETAHINVDECGAPEKFTSNKLITVKSRDGKIHPADLEAFVRGRGDPHHVQPTVVSVSQTTELGTLYSVDELKALGAFCRENDLYLHVDGSRLSNAAVALGKSFREFTVDCGVDVLSFGGTKNGILIGEAVLVFRPELQERAQYLRKQAMQLSSKMRYLSVQFETLLEDGLWKENATHANTMARRLADGIKKVPGVKLVQEPAANALFAQMPAPMVAKLLEKYYFYMWDESASIVRLMTSFETRSEEVDAFCEFASILGSKKA